MIQVLLRSFALPVALAAAMFGAARQPASLSAAIATEQRTSLPDGERRASLTRSDGPREQAIRNGGEAGTASALAEAPAAPRRPLATAPHRPPTATAGDRSRVRTLIDESAGLALLMALASSGAASTHSTSLPPPADA